MTDALSEIYREEERKLKVHQTLNELSLLIWYYASKYPKGELREEFITDTLETVCERLADRFASFEGDDMTQNGKENEARE